MSLERLLCPECGDKLSMITSVDEDSGELIIKMFCDGDRSDIFEFEIHTGLSNDDINNMTDVGKINERNMDLILIRRYREPS